ncbi:hypothetical protein FACS189496_5150 [Bacilli bacterium]|nr:hypothetical protein FACS189496_5150 [Bacilli bacterium]
MVHTTLKTIEKYIKLIKDKYYLISDIGNEIFDKGYCYDVPSISSRRTRGAYTINK